MTNRGSKQWGGCAGGSSNGAPEVEKIESACRSEFINRGGVESAWSPDLKHHLA